MPALVLQIINYVTLALKAAPQAKELYEEAKSLFQSLFNAGLITKEAQDAAMSWADEHQAATLAGKKPPEFEVE